MKKILNILAVIALILIIFEMLFKNLRIKATNAIKSTYQDLLTRAANYTKSFEGFSSKPYWDYKQWTNGYGTKANHKNEIITNQEAQKRLETRLKSEIDFIKVYNLKLTDTQIIALADFGYNVGRTPLKLMLNRLNQGWTITQISNRILLYTKADGKELDGLVKRRKSNVNYLNA